MTDSLFNSAPTGISAVTGRPIARGPHTRNGSPQASFDAAESVDIRESHKLVLRALRAGGPMSDENLFDFLIAHGQVVSKSGPRSRRAELVEARLVERHPKDGQTEGGRRCARWTLTEKGREAAEAAYIESRQERKAA